MAKDPNWREKYPNIAVTLADRDPEEARRIRQMGAKAQHEKWHKRKKLSEELIALLMNDDLQQKMCLEIIKSVIEDHNASAFVAIRDTIGEKPADVAINVNTDDEAARLTALEEAREKLGIGGAYDGEGETESASGEGAEGETVVSGEDPDTL